MGTWTAATIAITLCLGLWIPYFIMEIRRGKARGHTWFTSGKPRGHTDIGADLGGVPQTRHDVDDARGAHY